MSKIITNIQIGGAGMSVNKFLMIACVLAVFAFAAGAQVKCKPGETSYNLPCMKHELTLVNNKIEIKVYTKIKAGKKINKTFVVIHNNERKGLDAAKKVISENYGRLVEVVSNGSDEERKRYLYFGDNQANCVDPNRIFTRKGIRDTLKNVNNICTQVNEPTAGLIDKIQSFANALLNIVTDNNRYKFIIGVHNNKNSLSLDRWSEGGDEAKTAFGIFKANNHSEKKFFETGGHNFILATNGVLFGKLLDNGLYFAALQENKNYLTKTDERTGEITVKEAFDDGSMSIYFGTTPFGKPQKPDLRKPFDYINIEANGKPDVADENKKWQEKAIELVITNM
jgi:hypothetical protein